MAGHVSSPSPKQTLSLQPQLPQAFQERVRKLHSLGSPDPLGSASGPVLSSAHTIESMTLHFLC